MQILTPHVYWAQRHGEIYLRVELSDVKVGQSQHPPDSFQLIDSIYNVSTSTPTGSPFKFAFIFLLVWVLLLLNGSFLRCGCTTADFVAVTASQPGC